MVATLSVSERFWSKVDKDGLIPSHRPDLGQCWLWTAARRPDGYGYFDKTLAHMHAFNEAYGPPPEGLQRDHLCRNTSCVRPSHMEAVSPWENTRRGESFTARLARQTHCKRGHEFTPANTGTPPSGGRVCKACSNERKRLAYSRQVRPAANNA